MIKTPRTPPRTADAVSVFIPWSSRSRSFQPNTDRSPAAVPERSPPRRSISPRSDSRSRSRNRQRSLHGQNGSRRNGVRSGRSRTRSYSRSLSRSRSYSRSVSRTSPIPRSSKVCSSTYYKFVEADSVDCRGEAYQECQR